MTASAKHPGSALVVLVALFALVGCSSAAAGVGASHDYAETSRAMAAYSTGMTAAYQSTSSASSAYVVTGASGSTLYFNNYSSGTLTMNGSLAITADTTTYATTINGTLTFSGDPSVKSITYDHVSMGGAAFSGSLVIVFIDGSTWSYNYATQVFVRS